MTMRNACNDLGIQAGQDFVLLSLNDYEELGRRAAREEVLRRRVEGRFTEEELAQLPTADDALAALVEAYGEQYPQLLEAGSGGD